MDLRKNELVALIVGLMMLGLSSGLAFGHPQEGRICFAAGLIWLHGFFACKNEDEHLGSFIVFWTVGMVLSFALYCALTNKG